MAATWHGPAIMSTERELPTSGGPAGVFGCEAADLCLGRGCGSTPGLWRQWVWNLAMQVPSSEQAQEPAPAQAGWLMASFLHSTREQGCSPVPTHSTLAKGHEG